MLIEELKKNIKLAPPSAGVYQFFDHNNRALYIGKAKNLPKRLQNYTAPNRLTIRINKMIALASKLEIIPTATEAEALLLEFNLIKKLMPRYNILLRDDKSFPYIIISRDSEFGQIAKHRGAKTKKGHYFGPFASTHDVNLTIDILKKAFRLRSCSDEEFKRRKKPCLEYQIKRCSAPCVALISNSEYLELTGEALTFLEGKSNQVQQELARKMQNYSKNQEYEKASVIRDRIKALVSIQAKQNINLSWLNDTDILVLTRFQKLACLYIAFYRGGHNYGAKPYFIQADEEENESEIISAFIGQFYLDHPPPQNLILNHKINDQKNLKEFLSNLAEKKVNISIPAQGSKAALVKHYLEAAKKQLEQKLNNQLKDQQILLELKTLFHLPKIPQRIEVYDNSHISGTNQVGAVICAGKEGFIKSGYRKFNINSPNITPGDDYAILKQVLTRRFENLKEPNKDDNWPDLVIIDGGKGQLSAAKEVFEQLEIKDLPYIAISKGAKRNAGEEVFHQVNKESFTLPKNSPLMFYLQKLRDEAHRFAIGFHRSKRAKSLVQSELEEITFISRKRKIALLNHFGSVKAIKEATIEELCRVEGIGRKIAAEIKDYFGNS